MWGVIKTAYSQIFYEPLLWGLVFLASNLPGRDLGIAIILLTLIVKLILFPLTHKTLKTQTVMKKIEPEIKKIQLDHKDNREEQAKKLMELYRMHGINPFSGFLGLFIQLPILIALYHIFWKGLSVLPAGVNTVFLGLIALTEASVGMAALASLSQFWQAKLAIVPTKNNQNKGPDMASMMQKQMMYVFPIIVFMIAYKLPAAVSLYWTAMNIFAILHEAYVRHKARSVSDAARTT